MIITAPSIRRCIPALLLVTTLPATAADIWWKGDLSSIWLDRSPSSGPIVNTNFATNASGIFDLQRLPDQSDTVVFAAVNAANFTTSLGGGMPIQSVRLESTVSSDVVINGATITLSAGITNNSARILTVNANLAAPFSGTDRVIHTANSAGAVVLNGFVINGKLTKTGPGSLILGGSGSYYGGTYLNGGTIKIVSETGLTYDSNVFLNGGTLDLAGNTPTIDNITIGDGVTTATRQITSTVRNSRIDLNGSITYQGPGDPFVMGVPVNLLSGTHLLTSTAFSNSFYDIVFAGLLSGSGGFTKESSAYVAFTNAASYGGPLTLNSGYTFAAAPQALSPFAPLAVNAPAHLSLSPTIATAEVTPGSYSQTVGALSGNGTILLGAATLTVNSSASSLFSGVISGTGRLIKSGSGTLTISGTNTYTGQTTISQGAIRLGAGGTSGLIAGDILLQNGATFDINRSDSFVLPGRISGSGELRSFGSGTAILQANADGPHQITRLTIVQGVIDLENNDLIIDYTATSPIDYIIDYFNHQQLICWESVLRLPTYLAISEAADLGLTEFAGIAIDSTTVILKFTYVGDANLDGQVDALDYERIDLAIGNTGVFGTAQGDLNYDGNVDALDYEQIDLNIGNGVGTPLGSVFIPEPAALAPLALLPFLSTRKHGLARRRRLTPPLTV